MSKLLQLRGGTTAEHTSFTGALREVTVDTDKDTLVIHDGATAGGHVLPRTKADIDALNINADTLDGKQLATIESEYQAFANAVAANVVQSAPGTLNTLNELAAALNDNPNFATTTAANIATKANKTITVSAGSGLTGGGDLTANLTISHADTSSQASVDGSGRTYIQDITLDTYGHVTGIATATETVVDTDTTYSSGAGLDLSGTTFSVESDLRGDLFFMGRDTNDYFASQTDKFQWFLDGAEDMRLSNNGDLHVEGNVIAYSTTISDERLKTDIVKIDSALDKVDQLNGYTFTYTADGKKSAGVIAQEVEKVLPSAITESTLPLKMGEDDKTEYKTVQYDQLIGLLVEAVKELKAEIAELKGD